MRSSSSIIKLIIQFPMKKTLLLLMYNYANFMKSFLSVTFEHLVRYYINYDTKNIKLLGILF